MAAPGHQAFSSVVSGGCSLVAMNGLLIVVELFVAEPRLWSTWASVVATRGL